MVHSIVSIESPREIVHKHETTRGVNNNYRGESTYRVGRYHLRDDGDHGIGIILLLLCAFMCAQVPVPVALCTIVARVIYSNTRHYCTFSPGECTKRECFHFTKDRTNTFSIKPVGQISNKQKLENSIVDQ